MNPDELFTDAIKETIANSDFGRAVAAYVDNPALFHRFSSPEPKEGYFYEPFHFAEGGHWLEGDELYRARIMAHVHEHHGPTSGETRAPEEPRRDTSVRDAVHANR